MAVADRFQPKESTMMVARMVVVVVVVGRMLVPAVSGWKRVHRCWTALRHRPSLVHRRTIYQYSSVWIDEY